MKPLSNRSIKNKSKSKKSNIFHSINISDLNALYSIGILYVKFTHSCTTKKHQVTVHTEICDINRNIHYRKGRFRQNKIEINWKGSKVMFH